MLREERHVTCGASLERPRTVKCPRGFARKDQLEGGPGHKLKGDSPRHRVSESHMPGLSKQSLGDQQTAEPDSPGSTLGSQVAMVSSALSLGQPAATG